MNGITLCYLLALICFIIGAVRVEAKIDWQQGGFAFLVLSLLIR